MAKLGSIKPRLSGLPSRFGPSDRDGKGRDQHRATLKPWRSWYKTTRWEKLRQQVFIRDAFTCQRSGNRLKREHNDRAWLVWHIAALGRVKKLPKLKDLVHSEKPTGKRMTPEEMEAATRSWLASKNRKR